MSPDNFMAMSLATRTQMLSHCLGSRRAFSPYGRLSLCTCCFDKQKMFRKIALLSAQTACI